MRILVALGCAALLGCTWSSERHGVSVDLPPGWAVGRDQLLPKLAPPGAILSLATFDARRDPRRACSRSPGFPQLRVPPGEALVVVEEDRRGRADLAARRPSPFALRTPGRFPWPCLSRRGVTGTWAMFGEAGRLFTVTAVVGERAPPRLRRETLAVLESLRFERR